MSVILLEPKDVHIVTSLIDGSLWGYSLAADPDEPIDPHRYGMRGCVQHPDDTCVLALHGVGLLPRVVLVDGKPHLLAKRNG